MPTAKRRRIAAIRLYALIETMPNDPRVIPMDHKRAKGHVWLDAALGGTATTVEDG
jgi:hypothetical protein